MTELLLLTLENLSFTSNRAITPQIYLNIT